MISGDLNVAVAGERRQLTVMYCDLVGSTPLARQLDPEDWEDVRQHYYSLCASVIDRHSGHIAQYEGDGLLVYFGWPISFEDNAHRAVRAGLHILEELPNLNEVARPAIAPLGRNSLEVRLAIDTSLVVIRENDDYRKAPAVGDALNTARKLQSLAKPNTLVISAKTYSRVHRVFAFRNLGTKRLDRFSEPLEVYEALPGRSERATAEPSGREHSAPFVGREAELASLEKTWRQAQEGNGRVVMVSGEPGIGKSRLVQEFTKRSINDPRSVLTCRCSPYHESSTLFPVITLIRSMLGIAHDDPPNKQLAHLENALANHGLPLEEVVPLIAELISVPHSDAYRALSLPPEKKKRILLERLVEWIVRQSKLHPIRLLLEDLHWADASTLELLRVLVDYVPDSRILVVMVFRPEFEPPWGKRSYIEYLEPARLPNEAAEDLVRGIAGDRSLSQDDVRELVGNTDGVPLYVEESTLMFLAPNAGSERPRVPESLQDLLMARLDQLGDETKQTAQRGSTIGRIFEYDLLAAISPPDEADLDQRLLRLVDAGLLKQRGSPPRATYSFKHALVRDTAYGSLLRRDRRAHHDRIARTLETNASFRATRETQPELLAYHYKAAGLNDRAIPHYVRAGRRATIQYAHAEAVTHFRTALRLLTALPKSTERARLELETQVQLAGCLVATEGYSAPQVETAYARARELCREIDGTPTLRVMLGLESFYAARADFRTAHQFGDACLDLVERSRDAKSAPNVHWAIGHILFHEGRFPEALDQFERCLQRYDPRNHHSSSVQDPSIMATCYTAWGQWELGYPDQALETAMEAIHAAEKLSHPFSIGVAKNFVAAVHLFRREAKEAEAFAREATALCRDHGFRVWAALAKVLHGRARVSEGRIEEGVREIENGIALWRETGTVISLPYYMAQLAEALALGRRFEDALGVLTDALAMIAKNGELYYAAELNRLAGVFSLEVDHADPDKAETTARAYFGKALEIARSQGVKSLELRTITSFARLETGRRNSPDLFSALRELLDWFDEGHSTADLADARQLLGGGVETDRQ